MPRAADRLRSGCRQAEHMDFVLGHVPSSHSLEQKWQREKIQTARTQSCCARPRICNALPCNKNLYYRATPEHRPANLSIYQGVAPPHSSLAGWQFPRPCAPWGASACPPSWAGERSARSGSRLTQRWVWRRWKFPKMQGELGAASSPTGVRGAAPREMRNCGGSGGQRPYNNIGALFQE